MKKTVIALALSLVTVSAFAGTTASTDCGTSPSCISMGDATSKDNTVSQVNPTTASNGNDLGNDNTVKPISPVATPPAQAVQPHQQVVPIPRQAALIPPAH